MDAATEVIRLVTRSQADTEAMAEQFARLCRPGDVVALVGTLGSGKTCFVRGLARGLGVDCSQRVLSPTFVLLRRYRGRLVLYHFDAYRLEGPAEMEDIGCAEIFDAGGVSAVEWAERVRGCLPERGWEVEISIAGPQERRFRVRPMGPDATDRLCAARQVLAAWLAN